MKTLNKDIQNSLSPQMALQILKDGNHRFVNNLRANRNLLEQVNETAVGQFPFAVILSCIDSRTSAELIFDQGLGDIFSIRIAGNFSNPDILGSMEFAAKVAGSKLILVLGHTKCGAIKGACDKVELGNLTQMLEKIKPAVDSVISETKDRSSANANFVELVSAQNVRLTIQKILEESPTIREMIADGKLGIDGGMYDVETGKVEFYEDAEVFSNNISSVYGGS